MKIKIKTKITIKKFFCSLLIIFFIFGVILIALAAVNSSLSVEASVDSNSKSNYIANFSANQKFFKNRLYAINLKISGYISDTNGNYQPSEKYDVLFHGLANEKITKVDDVAINSYVYRVNVGNISNINYVCISYKVNDINKNVQYKMIFEEYSDPFTNNIHGISLSSISSKFILKYYHYF